jgi:short subunit dehydrogenase-like uncharacterized protein
MLLVYGSYGYTGRLVVERAVTALDEEVVLGGRDAGSVEAQGIEHDLAARSFTLDHDAVVRDRIADADAVLNCAGPFRETADPLVGACLDTGTHYLDVTGEVSVFEALAEYDTAAERRELTVLPGTGVNVVPTDCLAVHLAEALDVSPLDTGDVDLSLAVRTTGGVSGGTLRAAVKRLGEGGAIRRAGRIEHVPLAHRIRPVDFGDGRGPTRVVASPLPDVSTAARSADVPNVTTYIALPGPAVDLLPRLARLEPVFSLGPVRRALAGLAGRIDGPSAAARREGESHVWGELRAAGRRRVARLHLPETYAFTARAAVESARRVLAGEAPAGFRTPASAFGPDYVLDFEGTSREDAAAPDAFEPSGSGPAAEPGADPE